LNLNWKKRQCLHWDLNPVPPAYQSSLLTTRSHSTHLSLLKVRNIILFETFWKVNLPFIQFLNHGWLKKSLSLKGFNHSSFEPIDWLAKYSFYPRELAVRCFFLVCKKHPPTWFQFQFVPTSSQISFQSSCPSLLSMHLFWCPFIQCVHLAVWGLLLLWPPL